MYSSQYGGRGLVGMLERASASMRAEAAVKARIAAAAAAAKKARAVQAPPPKPRQTKPEPAPDFSHLLQGARERQANAPALNRFENGSDFARKMERVSAQLEGRKPRALVDGPQQNNFRVTGDQLVALAKQRNEERERALRVQRSGLVGG